VNTIYTKLSAMFFLEYAVWGAWMPVLAPRLLGTLKMSGKQTGWIFATLPLACIVAPILAGQVADRWIAAEWLLAGAHLIGAALLVLAAWQRRFWPLFAVMFVYSLLYAGTMPLATTVVLKHAGEADAGIIGRTIEWIVKNTSTKDVGEVHAGAGAVFVWAAIGWALVGYFLTGWRWMFKTEKQGTDAFYLAAALSVAMGLLSLVLPATPADASAGQGFGQMVKELVSWVGSNPNFCIFLGVSLFVAGTMQFYFIGTG
jgi:MFS family permease